MSGIQNLRAQRGRAVDRRRSQQFSRYRVEEPFEQEDSVPGDVSVVGFDDSAFMNCTDPPLTTVRQPIESMGKAAVALLVNQLENVAVYPEELLFEPELVVQIGRA